MPVLKAKEVEKNLCKKGFAKDNEDHRRFRFFQNGTKTAIRTMTSHNNQEIGDSLQLLMSRQLHLTKKEFFMLAICQMTEEEYTAIMKQRGYLP